MNTRLIEIGAHGDEFYDVRDYFAENLQPYIVGVYHRYKDLAAFRNIESFNDGNCSAKYCYDLLRKIWKDNWAPKQVASPATSSAHSKKRPASFLDTDSDDDEGAETGDLTLLADELSAYMGAITPPNDTCPLMWWKQHQNSFPSVALMARTFLGCPASTAGLERIYSKAGRMHSALKKNTTEETLKTKMLAAINTSS